MNSVDLVLRILNSVPLDINALLGASVTSAWHALLDLLSVALQSIDRHLTTIEDVRLPDELESPRPGDILKLVLRLLKFALGLPTANANTYAMHRPDFIRLATSYFKVLVVRRSAKESSTDALLSHAVRTLTNRPMTSHTTCLATLSTVSHAPGTLDDIIAAPAHSRSAIHTAISNEEAGSAAQAVIASSASLHNVLPYSTPCRRPMALSGIGVFDDGNIDSLLSLDDRPWELFDQLLPSRSGGIDSDQFLAAGPFRDTTSISMSLFNPKMKRDALPDTGIPSTQTDEGETVADKYASERNLGNGLGGEPMAAKEFATKLYAGLDEAGAEVHLTMDSSRSPLPRLDSAVPSATSISTAPSARQRRLSNRLVQTSEPTYDLTAIDEDDNKNDSDGLEESDAPVSKRPRTASKSRASVGGKAPARKTVGGKTVARKATGGKSVRKSTSGKAPRQGRRKSVVE